MSSAWIAVLVVGAATIALKGAGPVLAGGRELPQATAGVVELLAPALLAALVATNAFASDGALVARRARGRPGGGGVAIALRAPLLVVIVAAALTAGLLRAVS